MRLYSIYYAIIQYLLCDYIAFIMQLYSIYYAFLQHLLRKYYVFISYFYCDYIAFLMRFFRDCIACITLRKIASRTIPEGDSALMWVKNINSVVLGLSEHLRSRSCQKSSCTVRLVCLMCQQQRVRSVSRVAP